MDTTNYRIFKLKSGESIIANMVSVTDKNTIMMETPMVFKTVSSIENFSMREFLIIREWAEFATEKTIEISCESIMAILTPDVKITDVYNFEKEKSKVTEEEVDQVLKELGDKIDGQIPPPPSSHTINIQLKLPPEASMEFLELMGIDFNDPIQDIDDLDDEDLEEYLNESENSFSQADAVDEGVVTPPPVKSTLKSKELYGNSFDDWSPDPNDYLK